MIINEEYTVKVEKMINEGKGLARVGNIPVFVDNVCPNDLVKIRILKINKNYAIGQVIETVQPSEYRIKPECPFHSICGSCNWQHINYNAQLLQKKIIVEETINNISGIKFFVQDVIPSPKIYNYRCKVQLPVSQTKVSKRFLSGYYKKNTHELINIKCCKLHNEIINVINEHFKKLAFKYNLTAYNESTNKGLIRHVIYRYSSDIKQILVIIVINSDYINDDLKSLAKELIIEYPDIVGVCANYNTNNSNLIMTDNTHIIFGQDFYVENLDNIKFKISANSFFQVNPYCAKLLFEKVKSLISIENPTILDAYSGVSSFGIWLSSIAKKVICVEEAISSTTDAAENVNMNKIRNIKIINGDAAANFKKLINDGVKFDISIIDPPRKGCSSEAIKNLVTLTDKYIIYVSCNPSTLARDIKILSENGFYPEYIQPIDMFPQTAHIETIVLLKNKNI